MCLGQVSLNPFQLDSNHRTRNEIGVDESIYLQHRRGRERCGKIFSQDEWQQPRVDAEQSL